jgi:hypothetical protein
MSTAESAEPTRTASGPTASGPAGPTASGRLGSGLVAITVATVVAGGIGYVILALVPKFVTDPAQYLAFTNFWSGLYLLVAALSGLQQEVTRATAPASDGTGHLGRFALVSGLVAAAVAGGSAPLWAGHVFGEAAVPMVAALVLALVAYAGVAVLSGVFYGLKLWRAVAGLTIADAALRLVLVGAALLAGAGEAVISWAVALPFPLALGALWLLNRGRVVGRYAVDVPPSRLARNALNTVGGAVALGVLTSGLPLLIGVGAGSTPKATVAALVFVIILTRAPLVIPLLALQGWLTVYFRDRMGESPRPVVLVAGGVLGATLLVAAVAFVVEPWLLQAVWGAKYQVDAATCAGVVVTAGLTAALCATGPATLAAGRHTAYLAGWVTAALTTVGCLFLLPLPLTPRVLAAMALGPLVGMVVHFFGLTRAGAS